MTKKIIGIFGSIFLLFVYIGVYAQSLELITNTTDLDINNPLEVTISLADIPQGGNISIKGLQDTFDIVSKAQSQSIQIINGQKSATTQIQIQAKAKNTGDFTIGPAQIQIGTGIVQSNTVNVKVSGEKLFVNGMPQGWQNNPSPVSNTTNNGNISNTLNNTPTKQDVSSTQAPQKRLATQTPIRPILLLAGLLIIGIIFRQRQKQEREKKTHQKVDNNLPKYSEQVVGNFPTKSSAISHGNIPLFPKSTTKNYPLKLEQRIRSTIENILHIDTSSLTFQELHTLRTKKIHTHKTGISTQEEGEKKKKTDTLNKILNILEQNKYAEKDINLEELHKLAKERKKSIKNI